MPTPEELNRRLHAAKARYDAAPGRYRDALAVLVSWEEDNNGWRAARMRTARSTGATAQYISKILGPTVRPADPAPRRNPPLPPPAHLVAAVLAARDDHYAYRAELAAQVDDEARRGDRHGARRRVADRAGIPRQAVSKVLGSLGNPKETRPRPARL